LASKNFSFGSKVLDLDNVHVMGVLNVTPDSFSDGGQYNTLSLAMKRAERMILQGASIIDVGGESTRPGAIPVSVQEEMDRVCPVVEQLVAQFDVVVSVDTSTPRLMRESVCLGAGLINDVRAFSREGSIEAIKESAAALCVMHMQGAPSSMQKAPSYDSVVDEVLGYLKSTTERMVAQGIKSDRLLIDPGFGFGKTLQHNMQLLNGIGRFSELGLPVLVGLSRKSMFSEILNKPVNERLFGSLSAAVIAAYQGAKIIRAHDVLETKDAVRVIDAINEYANLTEL
jgi:dihydropteroate synthase